MSIFRTRNVELPPPTPKVVADTSRATTVSDAIRYECWKVTSTFISKLDTLGSGKRHVAVIRSLVMCSQLVPIRVMCVGLFPYEQNILPPIASALAYSPKSCIGATPSVQVLAQAMAIVASITKARYASRKKVTDVPEDMSEEALLVKFTTMLRSSYMCMAAGVVFVNAATVPASTTARRIRIASHFAEWLGNMILVHNRFGFRFSIIGMGSFAESTVRRCFSSFPGSSGMVTYTSCMNPAAISYMRLTTVEENTPISDTASDMEMEIETVTSVDDAVDDVRVYQWKKYPRAALVDLMGKEAVGMLAKALVDHTVPDLSKLIITMSKGLFQIASESKVGGANLGVAGAGETNWADQMNTESLETGDFTTDTSTTVRGNTGGFRDRGGEKVEVNRKSLIGQMMDPMNKNKSQQVLVIEHMAKTVAELIEMYKTRDTRIAALENAVVRMSTEMHAVMPTEEDLGTFVTTFREEMNKVMEDVKSAAAVLAAMPAVIDGDRGVIEAEIQPAAPIMRRADGSSIRDSMYVYARAEGGGEGAGVSNVDPNATMGESRVRTPAASHGGDARTASLSGTFSRSNMATTSSTPGGRSDNEMSKVRMEMAERLATVLEGDFSVEVSDAMWREVPMDSSMTGDETTDLATLMIEAMSMYSVNTSSEALSNETVKSVLEMIDPPTDEVLNEVVTMMRDLIKSSDDVVEFFEDAAPYEPMDT